MTPHDTATPRCLASRCAVFHGGQFILSRRSVAYSMKYNLYRTDDIPTVRKAKTKTWWRGANMNAKTSFPLEFQNSQCTSWPRQNRAKPRLRFSDMTDRNSPKVSLPVARREWSTVDFSLFEAMVKNRLLRSSLRKCGFSIIFHRIKWKISRYITKHSTPPKVSLH